MADKKIAVIKTGGKQYVVKEGDKIKVEKLKVAGLSRQSSEGVKAEDKVDFETLLVADGDKLEVGSPILKSRVEGKALRQARARKVEGVKYKPKTRQSTRFGHRQHFTEVEITKI